MRKTYTDDCAFPVSTSAPGLSKREYFAALAMANMASRWEPEDSELRDNPEKVGRMALRYADALIAALNEGEGK